MQKTFIFLFLILTHNAFTEVTPPNYNFNLKQLSIFFPGEKLSIVSKSYKNPILLSDIGEDILYQKYVKDKIPVEFFKNGKLQKEFKP